MIPSPTEQKKIGSFFQNLDNLVTLHQKKYDKLIVLKKAMLVKMFPKNGAVVPEIRFKGFSADWEEKKLGEIGEIVTGSTPSTQNKHYYSETGVPWVTPTDINENVTINTYKKLSPEGEKIARIVPKDTILVTCIASIGKNTILGTKGSFNQQINGLVPVQNLYNIYFLYTLSSMWSTKMNQIASIGTMQNVNKSEFSKISTYLPQINEQKKIGKYFKNLDHQIALHQTQLEKLNNIKKACFTKMFVAQG
jgi:type I restriction enzyme S subunit